SAPLLAVDNLSVAFGPSRVVENLSFSVRAGRTLAIVGESGSGKSVTSLSVMRLADMMGGQFPIGQVLFESRQGRIDLTTATQKT
ncbi:ATP-binding cassette domain-containing protein, partial [Klebsiella michiganensis]|uniref:ATP-binding cassette domain-containing protein n=2 Tax=Pseudomonadota TaxID=1224 RepID=UPI0013CFC879